jgi:hypothetical protein
MIQTETISRQKGVFVETLITLHDVSPKNTKKDVFMVLIDIGGCALGGLLRCSVQIVHENHISST